MTFIEAATYVLEREGRPLRSREIAEKAVALGILSHVGKTPVQTMSARLSAAVAKGRDDGPFVRVRPGVFGLFIWKEHPPKPAKRAVAPRPAGKEAVARSAKKAAAPQPAAKERPVKAQDGDRQDRSQAVAARETPAGGEGGGQKKRKRKKRKSSHGPSPAAESTSRAQPETSEPETAPPPPAPARGMPVMRLASVEDIVGRVESVLKKSSRPLPLEQVYEQVGIKGESGSLLIEAVLAADGFERAASGLRPRFIKHKSGYGLVEREVSSEIVALEKQAFEVRGRLLQIAERQVLRKLRGLSLSGFVRVMILYLQRAGFGAIVPVDLSRPGEFHLSVEDRRHQGRFRTAVVLRRDSAEFILSQRTVMDLRGAMHHYDAMGGMILTTGQVGDEAVAEGRVANLAPVALIDGETIAREMVRLGIGVKERPIQLPAFDEQFFGSVDT
jgi:hypothetical protein